MLAFDQWRRRDVLLFLIAMVKLFKGTDITIKTIAAKVADHALLAFAKVRIH